jgi:hypothetical protein
MRSVIALFVYWFAAKQAPPDETNLYTYFLAGLLFASDCELISPAD